MNALAPGAGDEILPKGRLVRIDLEIRLPVSASKKDVDDWIALHFGVGSLRNDSPLSRFQPEPFDRVMLTDTGLQGRIVETGLRRVDRGVAYTQHRERFDPDSPQPEGRILWILPNGATQSVVAAWRPTYAEITMRLLGEVDWLDVVFEGVPAQMFHAKPWRGTGAPNPVATALAAGSISRNAARKAGAAIVLRNGRRYELRSGENATCLRREKTLSEGKTCFALQIDSIPGAPGQYVVYPDGRETGGDVERDVVRAL